MRLWRGVSKSMFTCFLTEDRFYDYAVKVATGSDYYLQLYYRTFPIRERYIVPVRSNFPVPVGHNANFVWNQDEVSQNSRYAKRFYYSRQLSAQSGSCQTNQLRSSSLLLGTLSHGAHEPISVVLRTSFLDAPATMRHFYGSKCLFAKIAIPCTIYLSLNLL